MTAADLRETYLLAVTESGSRALEVWLDQETEAELRRLKDQMFGLATAARYATDEDRKRALLAKIEELQSRESELLKGGG